MVRTKRFRFVNIKQIVAFSPVTDIDAGSGVTSRVMALPLSVEPLYVRECRTNHTYNMNIQVGLTTYQALSKREILLIIHLFSAKEICKGDCSK